MSNMKIVSLNVHGLSNGLKRRKIFRYIKKYKADLCMLQETHCTKNYEQLWSSEWGNKCIYANGSSGARGVAMLLTKKTVNIQDVCRDINGRYLVCKLLIEGYTYCITNIYAPNVNDPSMFKELFDVIRSMNCVHHIIGGDLNVVQDIKIDRNSERVYNNRNYEEIKIGMEEYDLVDIWRARNPEKRFFTWMKCGDRLSWSRIDYFLISQSLCSNCCKAEIIPSVQTDHSMITLEISTTDNKRGPGCWKFNNSACI